MGKLFKITINSILIFISIITIHLPMNAYQFDYSKELQFQHPDNGQSFNKLNYTIQLMNYLQQKYSDQVQIFWNFDWTQPYLGAGSQYLNQQFSILLYGGFIRAEGSSFQLLAFTLCHEVGHFLGGTPKQKFANSNSEEWSSAEGQADWFAASQCLPDLYDSFAENQPQLLQIDFANETQELCSDSENIKKCQWILSAGKNFTDFDHYYFNRENNKPSLQSTSEEIVEHTLVSTYPSSQCRLDTIKNGALAATSLQSTTHTRPACWFKQD